MKRSKNHITKVMHVLSWIIFIGLCIQAGAFIFSFIISLFVNARAAHDLYKGLDLSALYQYNRLVYISVGTLILVTMVLKARIFYWVIKIFMKIDWDNPFTEMIATLVSKISYLALSVGILTYIGHVYCMWFVKRGVDIPYNWGNMEFIFMAGVIFLIALILRRGVEIQSENELTI